MVTGMHCGADRRYLTAHMRVYLRDKQFTGLYHSVSAVGCRSCASSNDLINALLVNGRIALWERDRGQGTEVTLERISIN